MSLKWKPQHFLGFPFPLSLVSILGIKKFHISTFTLAIILKIQIKKYFLFFSIFSHFLANQTVQQIQRNVISSSKLSREKEKTKKKLFFTMALVGYEEEKEIVEWGLGWEKVEKLSISEAELSVLVAERLSLRKKIDEVSSAEIIVVVEFLVLEDQSSLVEAVLSGWRSNMWKGCSSGRSRWWWWSIMVILAGK